MTAINRIFRLFASEEIGPGARILALLYGILNAPAVLLALIAVWLWPITIPGMVMYGFFWRSVFSPGSWSHTKGLWTWTLFYNIFFLLIGAYFLLDGAAPAWWLLLPMTLNIGISGIALRSLIDHKAAREVEEKKESIWKIHDHDSSVVTTGLRKLDLESWG